MKHTWSLLGAAAIGAALVTGPAWAQQPAAAPPAGQTMAAPAAGQADAGAPPPYSAEDARAILNARLAALKAVIELTPEQDKLWPALETAVRDIVKDAAQRRAQRSQQPPPATFLDVLGRIADAEETRGKDLRRFVEAAKPFVASLSDAQKRRVPAFLGMTDHPGGPQPSAQIWLFEEEDDQS
ncbi:Spy/CpxP family protein refolding chaperone [Chelatococcus reniformis]|uniref:LTXXQ motif family protein n=1 Tax=Chelatococcus reniformis TaxID=1494448 RepID=A0A916X9T6_9HYPH|nr:Spy/CpxP family protein refolding chaperone [Chelatococcus reniformis]GGC54441.1 hypothetical protein GCM10010994_11760 [Chelatococcus reniformis]